MATTFRDATIEDAAIINRLVDVVQAIHAEALPGHFKPAQETGFPPKAIARHLKQPGAFVALCLVDGEPAGYIGVRVINRRQDGLRYAQKVFMLDQIAVAPAFRRQGVGRALIEQFRARAKAAKADKIVLEVWDFNAEALAFFAACGFQTYKHALWQEP